MKVSPPLKATIVVIIIAGGLFFGWTKYYAFLTSGRRPPESSVILNKIEVEGVPDFTLKDLSGADVTLSAFRGKVVILNFWASWCDPCIAEFPSLLKLIDEMKGQVILLAVSADYEEKDIHTFLKAFKATSPYMRVMWDKDYLVAKKFGTYRLPESYLIGADGKLIRKVSGIDDWSTPEAFAYFKELVAAAPK